MRKNNSKIISHVIAVIILAVTLSGCGQGNAGKEAEKDAGKGAGKSDRLSVVTTIFPEYDWVMNILGGKAKDAEVTMLLDSGVDLHSYQPVMDDIIKISSCDVFIYAGGESDKWMEDALDSTESGDMIAVNLMESLGDAVKEEEIIEGMQKEAEEVGAEEDAAEAKEAGDKETAEAAGEKEAAKEAEEKKAEDKGAAEAIEEKGEAGEEPEYDEHVWLSLKNAAVLCDVIKDALCAADADNAEVYKSNAEVYIKKLNDLDAKYQAAADAAKKNTLLFCDRFPFRYLMDDYGLSCYAAFAGCSAETEASFETVAFLAGKVDELGLSCVLTLEKSDQKIAKTVVETTAAKSARILSMDSMQSTTSEDVKNNASYLSIMEKNLEVMKEALK